MQGRGLDALLWMALGTLCTLLLLCGLAPAMDVLVRPVHAIIQPHAHWMLLAVTAFLVLGEWPRANENQPPLRRLLSAWAYLGAGLLTFLLSGLLGLVLMTRSPIPIEAAYQNLMPAFVGLFTLPGLLQAASFGRRLPAQHHDLVVPTPGALLRASITGLAGGGFAAVMPVIGAGIGGLLAGHATAQRGEQQFMIGQGATRAAYFGGGLLLLFVPGVGLVRGGMSWMMSSVYSPAGWPVFLLAIAAIAGTAAASFLLLGLLARPAVQVVSRLGPQRIAGISGIIALGCVLVFTGIPGLVVAAVGTTIGLIPTFVGGRRLNCLGVLLVPIVLNMNGWQGPVLRLLGL
jgi:putative membrane protein